MSFFCKMNLRSNKPTTVKQKIRQISIANGSEPVWLLSCLVAKMFAIAHYTDFLSNVRQ